MLLFWLGLGIQLRCWHGSCFVVPIADVVVPKGEGLMLANSVATVQTWQFMWANQLRSHPSTQGTEGCNHVVRLMDELMPGNEVERLVRSWTAIDQ